MISANTVNPTPRMNLKGIWLDNVARTDTESLRAVLPSNPTSSADSSLPLPIVALISSFSVAGGQFQALTPVSGAILREFSGLIVETSAPEGAFKFQTTAATAPSIDASVEMHIEALLLRTLSATSHEISATFLAGLADLQNIVSAIHNRSRLQLSEQVEALIERASRAHGIPENLEEWARRLADDVGDLVD